jgi:hypothetical protein
MPQLYQYLPSSHHINKLVPVKIQRLVKIVTLRDCESKKETILMLEHPANYNASICKGKTRSDASNQCA